MPDRFDEFRRFEEMMNRMFEDIWNVVPGRRPLPLLQSPLLSSGERALERVRKPFVDVVETDKDVIATAEMPGLEKSDININITGDILEISAETKKEEEKKEEGYVYKERRSGSYYRAISLPSAIDPENTKATYNNGVLEVTMPKTEVKKKIQLKVE
jgi:HSP20 family protein